MTPRKMTELERAVYETPDGRLCTLILVVGSHGDGAGRRDLLRSDDGKVTVCYLEDGRIPTGRMEWGEHAPAELVRVGELADARSMA